MILILAVILMEDALVVVTAELVYLVQFKRKNICVFKLCSKKSTIAFFFSGTKMKNIFPI